MVYDIKRLVLVVEIRPANTIDEVYEGYALASHVFSLEQQSFLIKKKIERYDILDNAIIALQNGRIIGFIQIVERMLNLSSCYARTGGITNVCIHPDSQGKGIGRQMMEFTISYLKKKRYILAATVARRAVDGYYSKFGFIGIDSFFEMTISKYSFQTLHYRQQCFLLPQALFSRQKQCIFLKEFPSPHHLQNSIYISYYILD